MSLKKDAWTEAQRRRWMRPDTHLWIRPDAYRFIAPDAPRLLGKQAVRYFWPERTSEPNTSKAPSELVRGLDQASERHAPLRLKNELAAIKNELKFRSALRGLKAGFNPDQPRDDYGQWTDAGGDEAVSDENGASDATDFSAARRAQGHHFVPQSVYRDLPLQPDTRRVFDAATTGPLNAERHGWSRDHDVYNQAVDESLERFMRSNGIRPETMTPDQARSFVNEVRSSTEPRIRNFNLRILKQEVQYYLRRLPRIQD